jgi:hypothetical protein
VETRDIVEIQQLMALYGHAVDAADQSMLPLVFTEDAVFDATAGGYDLMESRDAIAAWFALGKPPHPPSHHMTNAYVYEANGETRVKSKWLIINARNGTVLSGDYDDLVVRTTEGWRIKRRNFMFRYPVSQAAATGVG